MADDGRMMNFVSEKQASITALLLSSEGGHACWQSLASGHFGLLHGPGMLKLPLKESLKMPMKHWSACKSRHSAQLTPILFVQLDELKEARGVRPEDGTVSIDKPLWEVCASRPL